MAAMIRLTDRERDLLLNCLDDYSGYLAGDAGLDEDDLAGHREKDRKHKRLKALIAKIDGGRHGG